MPRRRVPGNAPRRPRKQRRRFPGVKVWPPAATRRRWLKAVRHAPLSLLALVGIVVLGGLAFAVNGIYQVVVKPTELFFPVAGTLYKVPAATWAEYAPIFRKHATPTIPPELLAALAQVEGSGNPVVRTYWRWSFAARPFDVYRPASSAVGMYQITDGTFAEARRYCIHDHAVVEDGPWNDPRSCWFNSLYFRVVPSHAVELTSAYLDVRVRQILRRHRIAAATPGQKQEVATLIHLCGAGMANRYVARGFRFLPGQRCGDHDPRVYLGRVSAMKRVFAGLVPESATRQNRNKQ